jgi:hypothetical protein
MQRHPRDWQCGERQEARSEPIPELQDIGRDHLLTTGPSVIPYIEKEIGRGEVNLLVPKMNYLIFLLHMGRSR